jgi:hypothetical protein
MSASSKIASTFTSRQDELVSSGTEAVTDQETALVVTFELADERQILVKTPKLDFLNISNGNR